MNPRGIFTKQHKLTLHSTAVAAGITVITPSTAIDMQDFDSCTFVAVFGAIVVTGVQSVEVHESDSPSSGFTALAGSKIVVADSDDDKAVFVEIHRPLKRYLKMVVNRATANSTLNAIIAIQSQAKLVPVSHDATVLAASELWLTPNEGAA